MNPVRKGNATTRYCFVQVEVIQTFTTCETQVGIISQEDTSALNQRPWNSLFEERLEILGLTLSKKVINFPLHKSERKYPGELKSNRFCKFNALYPRSTTYSTTVHVKTIRIGGIPKNLAYLIYLIKLIRARKEWTQIDKLHHDCAERLHIDRIGIITAQKQDFRGTIPAKSNVFSIWWSTFGLASMTKIGERDYGNYVLLLWCI